MKKSELTHLCETFTPQRTKYFPTGIPQFDIAWGGGLQSGRIIELHGNAGLGKSTIMAQAGLNRSEAGDKVAYLDVEHGLETSLINGLADTRSGLMAGQGQGGCFLHRCPSSFNEIDMVLDTLLKEEFDLIIIDTIAMVTGDSTGTKVGSRLSRTDPAATSRLQAELLRQYRPRIARSGATLLLGNQMRKEIGTGKSRLKPCGGQSLDHGIDVRTRIYPQKPVLSPCRQFHRIMVTTQKNRFRCPHEELPLLLHFGSGVNRPEALGMMLVHFDAVLRKRGHYLVPQLAKALHGELAFMDWVTHNEDRAVEILGAKVGYDLAVASR